jgi:phospholipase C
MLDTSHALEHVVLEPLENRSFDNVIGRLNR